MKDLPLRLAVAFIGIPLLAFAVLKGEIYFFAVVLVISIVGQWELYEMLKPKGVNVQKIPAIVLGSILLHMGRFGWDKITLIISLAIVVYIFAVEMFRNVGSANLNIAGTLQGVFYPVLFLASLLFLRQHAAEILPAGQNNAAGKFILTIFVSVWGCDTFAYFAGSKFGRHRLFERVSPKKSIEGAVAGLFGALLVFFLVEWIGVLELSLTMKVVSGIIVGTIGQLGDLVESWFKRDAGIKDSSKILPGHGGILDRFDSLMFISPVFVIFYLIMV